jgi:hypothetical protein
MTLRRVAPLVTVVLIGLGGPALAQMPLGAPTPDGSGQLLLQPPVQQEPPCMRDFVPLRNAAQKHANTLQAAIKRQVPPQELCALFNTFSEAEAKVVKFIEANANSCGIPPQILATTKSNHSKTVERKQQVCAAAQFGQRRGPGLSDALGMRAVPTPETTSNGKGGAFDTMSGSPLAR